jgi:hypothetical protein
MEFIKIEAQWEELTIESLSLKSPSGVLRFWEGEAGRATFDA